MRENFDHAFELVIGVEGGFTDDRKDRGNWTSGVVGKGERKGTKYGVSAMSYPDLDIKNLTLDQAKDIYFRDYWSKVRCDDFPTGLDYLMFDMAVNHGTAGAVRFLQTAVGAVIDGEIGPRTLERVRLRKPVDIIIETSVRRMMSYTEIKTFKDYGLGWTRRAFNVASTAIDMAQGPLDQSNTGFGLFRRVA